MDRFPVPMPRPLRLSAAPLIASVVVGCEPAQDEFDLSTVATIPTAESEALVALYDSTDGENWNNNAGWLLSADPCSWKEVTCSSGNVIWVDLILNSLTGSIPAKLGHLTDLQYLGLGWNQLTGTIPAELGNLTDLTYLSLNANNLTGSIPAELGNLIALSTLALQGNDLTGSIPAELGNLTALNNELDLFSNNLTGSIPAELGNLTALSVLALGSNDLTGSIPAELGNLTALSSLSLRSNNLTGSIPAELGDLTSLEFLWLHANQLSGLVPLPVAKLGGELQQIAIDRCNFLSNPGLFMPDSQDYMDADIDNDGFICGIGLRTPSP